MFTAVPLASVSLPIRGVRSSDVPLPSYRASCRANRNLFFQNLFFLNQNPKKLCGSRAETKTQTHSSTTPPPPPPISNSSSDSNSRGNSIQRRADSVLLLAGKGRCVWSVVGVRETFVCTSELVRRENTFSIHLSRILVRQRPPACPTNLLRGSCPNTLYVVRRSWTPIGSN